jgi:hypothetical protein
MVTTFLVDIVFDHEQPSWKGEYCFDPIIEEGSLDSTVEEDLATFLQLSRERDAKKRYTYEVLHHIAASRNWTTDEFWRRANETCAQHAQWLDGGHWAPLSIREGKIPAGAKKSDDFAKVVSPAISSGRLTSMEDKQIIEGLLRDMVELENLRRSEKGLGRMAGETLSSFRKKARDRIRYALKTYKRSC